MSHPEFNPSCPSGGQWYACGTGAKFVGCCTSDPCSDAGCSAGNLRSASFDVAYWGTEAMPDQQCASSAQWWSCTGTNPPFLGCCSSNPCSNTTGCPPKDLIQGVLSNAVSVANRMDPQPPLPSNDSGNGISIGVIVGAVIGGCAVLAVAVGLIWWTRRRKNKRVMAARSVYDKAFSPRQPEKNNCYQDTPSTMTAYSPAPQYGFQQPFVHEADAGNRTHTGYGPVPLSSPRYTHQTYNSNTSEYSTSPQVGTMSSYAGQMEVPSELGDNKVSLRGLGVQQLPPINQVPVELSDSHVPLADHSTDSKETPPQDTHKISS